MKIWNVFHPSLLSLDPGDPLPGQEHVEPPPIMIDNEEYWEVEDILASKKMRQDVHYKAKWVDCDRDETWYPSDNFTNSQDVLRDFHARNPRAARPSWLCDVDDSNT